MLSEWLAPETVDAFRATRWHREAFVRPEAARATAGPPSTGRRLGRCSPRNRAGPARRSPRAARRRSAAADASCAARVDERRSRRGRPPRRAIACATRSARARARRRPARPDPPPALRHADGHDGVRLDYDVEDVFIVQTAGTKDYYFRANTVDPDRPPEVRPHFALVRGETTPIGTCRLLAGDWLYVPARWWHVAKCVEDSLSISFGVLADEPQT